MHRLTRAIVHISKLTMRLVTMLVQNNVLVFYQFMRKYTYEPLKRRHTQTHTDTDTSRHRHTHRHAQTHTHTHTRTHRHTHTDTQTHAEKRVHAHAQFLILHVLVSFDPFF